MLFSKLAAVLLPLFGSTPAANAQQYPKPGACNGVCYARDPAVVKKDGTYYRFTTRELIGIQTAPTISGPWTKVGSVVQGSSVIDLPGRDELWAPDVRLINGVYFCLYSVSELGSNRSAVGYATSPSMAPGSWIDHGALVRSDQGDAWNAIDGNLYKGPGDGEWYVQWGSYHQGIFSDRVVISGNKLRRSGYPQNMAYYPPRNHPQEGAFMFHHGNHYYQFLSRGRAGNFPNPESFPLDEAYHIVVCRAQNPRGNFVDKQGVPCLEGGGTVVTYSQGNIFAPGGQGVFTDSLHGDVLYYHYLNRDVGYGALDARFGWNVINWVDGWPTI